MLMEWLIYDLKKENSFHQTEHVKWYRFSMWISQGINNLYIECYTQQKYTEHFEEQGCGKSNPLDKEKHNNQIHENYRSLAE